MEPLRPLNDRLVRIACTYKDVSVGLSVAVGPEGCCRDADPRKITDGTPIRDGITAHYLNNQPEFGGPIPWWNESGAYVAVSGPHLTKEDLIEIAESMSDTATLNAYQE